MIERRAVCQVPCSDVQTLKVDLAEIKGDVRRMKADLYNGDDNPEAGIVPEIRNYLAMDRAERAKRMKTGDKVALLSAIILFLVVPAGWATQQAIHFFGDLYQITQEWHQLHKTAIPLNHSFLQQVKPSVSSN